MRHVVLIVRNAKKAKKNGRKIKKYETFITENGKLGQRIFIIPGIAHRQRPFTLQLKSILLVRMVTTNVAFIIGPNCFDRKTPALFSVSPECSNWLIDSP